MTFLSIGVLSIGITGWLSYHNSKLLIKEAYFDKLTTIREAKKMQIESYFNLVNHQISTFSEDQIIVDAMVQFKKAFFNLKNENEHVKSKIQEYTPIVMDYYQNQFLPKLNAKIENKGTLDQYWPEDKLAPYQHAIFLQYQYIVNNPNPLGFKDKLIKSNDNTTYSKVHSIFHPVIRNFQKQFGYYDILLVDNETGNVIYSVFKEVDFATNLLTGPYKDSNIAKVFNQVRKPNHKKITNLIDFDPYYPSYSKPAAFMGTSVFNGDKNIGVLIFQIPIDKINRMMTGNFNWKKDGLGKSGETYIVGSDYKMRNDSRFIIEEPERYFNLLKRVNIEMDVIKTIKSHSTSILLQEVHTDAVKDSLKGNEGTGTINDYRGIPVLSSYTPLNIKDVNWVMLSEIDENEVLAGLYILRNKIATIMVITLLFILIVGIILSNKISNPILLLTKTIKNVRNGIFTNKINVNSNDEIGELTTSFNKINENFNKTSCFVKNILDVINCGVIVLTHNKMIKIVNNEALNILGHSEDKLIGKPLDIIFAKDTLKEQTIEKLIKNGSCKNIEKDCITMNKNNIPILFSGSIVYDTSGNIREIICIIQDHSEFKRKEAVLLKSENRYKLLLEAIPDIVYKIDLKGNFTYINHSIRNIGYEPGELIGKHFSTILSDKTSTFIRNIILTKYTGKVTGDKNAPKLFDEKRTGKRMTKDLEIKLTKKEDKVLNGKDSNVAGLLTSYVEVDATGEYETRTNNEKKLVGSIGIIRDITEKVKLQTDVIRSRQLAVLGELAACVAHEVNNPINSVINCAQLMIDRSDAESPDYHILENIIKESDRIANVISSLLSIARQETEIINFFDIEELISKTLILEGVQMKKDAIKIIINIQQNTPLIYGSSQKIQQVLMNILNNARYALNEKYPEPHDNKIVKITGKEITINDSQYIQIVFRDHGRGIPVDKIKNVMNPFFTTKPIGKGTGLGLSISNRIIKDHGGTLELNSVEAKHTDITIILPATKTDNYYNASEINNPG